MEKKFDIKQKLPIDGSEDWQNKSYSKNSDGTSRTEPLNVEPVLSQDKVFFENYNRPIVETLDNTIINDIKINGILETIEDGFIEGFEFVNTSGADISFTRGALIGTLSGKKQYIDYRYSIYEGVKTEITDNLTFTGNGSADTYYFYVMLNDGSVGSDNVGNNTDREYFCSINWDGSNWNVSSKEDLRNLIGSDYDIDKYTVYNPTTDKIEFSRDLNLKNHDIDNIKNLSGNGTDIGVENDLDLKTNDVKIINKSLIGIINTNKYNQMKRFSGFGIRYDDGTHFKVIRNSEYITDYLDYNNIDKLDSITHLVDINDSVVRNGTSLSADTLYRVFIQLNPENQHYEMKIYKNSEVSFDNDTLSFSNLKNLNNVDINEYFYLGEFFTFDNSGNVNIVNYSFYDNLLNYPRGEIKMFSAKHNPPLGWTICNGNNGTPNLQGRFIVGYDSGYSDYNETRKIGGEKSHTLTVDEMPSHNHGGITGDYNLSHKHYSFSNNGDSGNTSLTSSRAPATSAVWEDGSNSSPAINDYTIANATTTDEANVGKTSFSGGNHHHSISLSGGDTAHENRPPYYTLFYAMKI